MKPHKPAVPADQGVSRNATEQLSGDWYSNLIDFDGPSFLEYDRVRVSPPPDIAAGRALKGRARTFECRLRALQVVFASVPFHETILAEFIQRWDSL
jgi:hypothetical protein